MGYTYVSYIIQNLFQCSKEAGQLLLWFYWVFCGPLAV